MKIGDITYLKSYPSVIGEIKAIDDMDKVTLVLCDTGLEIIVHMADIGVTGATQPQREKESTVNILGTPYNIRIIKQEDYAYGKEADGWCDTSVKEIVIHNYKQSIDCLKDLKAYQKKVLRHEIVHAFLYESGLSIVTSECKSWAENEEMVDWIAIQEPKIHRAFVEAGCAE